MKTAVEEELMIDRYYAARHTLGLVGKWLDAFDPRHLLGPDSPIGEELGIYMLKVHGEALVQAAMKLAEVPEIAELVENGYVDKNKSLPQCFRDLLAHRAGLRGLNGQMIIERSSGGDGGG
jgi:hypothetical protein